MKFFLIVLSLFISSFAFSQSGEQAYVYCELVGAGKFMNNKVSVTLDLGQSTKYLRSNKSRLFDENGNSRNFNSMIDALNFTTALGWEFVQAYTVSENGKIEYHWLLRQKITEDEQKILLELIK